MNRPLLQPWMHGHLAWPFFILLVWFLAAILLWDIAWRLLTVRFSMLLLGGLTVWAAITVVLWITLSVPW